jgi:hypothetical protein
MAQDVPLPKVMATTFQPACEVPGVAHAHAIFRVCCPIAHERLPMGSVRPVGANSYPSRAFLSSWCIRALQ